MRNALLTTAAAAVLALAPLTASASTLIQSGGTYNITAGAQFDGDVTTGAGGSGSAVFTFNALSDPLFAAASATIGKISLGNFTNLQAAWISVASNITLASTPVAVGTTELATVFTSPSNLSQKLVFTWDGSAANRSFDVEVQVAPVPVPAAGLMLLTALGGVAAMRRRKTA